MSVDDGSWRAGWVDPLQQEIHMTLERKTSSEYRPLFERLLAQANQAVKAKTSDRDVFRTLLNDLTNSKLSASQASLSER